MKNLVLSVVLLVAVNVSARAGEISSNDLTALPFADIVILGEVHDNPLHHLAQAKSIAAIKPKAVVFEMLSPEQAAKVTPELLTDQSELGAMLDWESSGWPDFALYYPVFAAIGEVQVFGAARPRDDVRKVFEQGAAAVFGPTSERFGLKESLPEKQLTQRMQEQFDAHCEAMPLEMMGGMVEAQRFRDAAFGEVVIQAYEETGGPVVLIAGNGHARSDWGVPAMLLVGAPDLSVLTVGFLEAPAEDEPPFDLWVMTEPAIREDPCLAFK